MLPARKKWQNEEQFTNAVIDLFRMCGWLVHHDRGEMRKRIQGNVGFPDIVAVHPKRGLIIAAELKMPKGVISTEQYLWMDALGAIGCPDECRPIDVFVWRPDNWDEIIATATGR